MIKKIFSQNQIIQAIEKYQKSKESAQIILDTIEKVNIEEYPLEVLLELQWILESLLKTVLKKNDIEHNHNLNQNVKKYFKYYHNSLLDKRQIHDIIDFRNHIQHHAKIRDKGIPVLIKSLTFAIKFIAIEANVDLNSFTPPSSTKKIKSFAKKNEIEIDEEKEEKKAKIKKIKKYLTIPLILVVFIIYYFFSDKQEINILTGSENGTYSKMFLEVKENYNDNINIVSTEGSGENIKWLGTKKYIGYALLQEDVLKFFIKEANKYGKISSKNILNNISLLKPILKEEIHILVREDSNMSYFRDLKGKEVAIGKEKSGNAITATTLYNNLFPKETFNKHYSSNLQKSLSELKDDNSDIHIDAIIVVGGVPFNNLKGESGIKLLSYKENNLSKKYEQGYEKGIIKNGSYGWLKEDIGTLMVTSFLITNIEKEEDIQLLPILDKLKKDIENNKTSTLTFHIKWKESLKLNCLPNISSNRIIYHSIMRQNSYCSEE